MPNDRHAKAIFGIFDRHAEWTGPSKTVCRWLGDKHFGRQYFWATDHWETPLKTIGRQT